LFAKSIITNGLDDELFFVISLLKYDLYIPGSSFLERILPSKAQLLISYLDDIFLKNL
jgi:hypothetical protein